MIKINVILNNNEWFLNLRNPNIYIKKKIDQINKKFKVYNRKTIFCTLLLSGDKKIKYLNQRFRNKNKSTDVLSFPFYEKRELKKKLKNEKEVYLGDIIINYKKIKYKKSKKDFNFEFNKLWIHGLTHLLGYDHKKKKEYNKMIKIEKKLISCLD
tara:strand:- start:18 stop:482 length:465 start_codon:yes stop_codon:yes gene_type:complete